MCHTRHYNKHTRYHTTAEETGAQRNCVNSPRSSKFKTQSLIAPLALAYAIKLCWGRRVQKLSATGHSLHLNTTVSRSGGHRGRASTNTHQDSTLGTMASDRSSLPMSNCHDRAQAMPEKHGPSESGRPRQPAFSPPPPGSREQRGFICRQWLRPAPKSQRASLSC